MKMRNSFAVVSGCATAVSLMAVDAQAQSAFAGFYGQVSTGYESNQLGGLSGNAKTNPNVNTDLTFVGPSQTFGGAPLVLGTGYYWQASEKWLIGAGADYSALSQTSSSIPLNHVNAPDGAAISTGSTLSGNGTSVKLSNRFNLFVTPGYAIDQDKLVYLKAGFTQVNAQYSRTSSLTKTTNGVSTTTSGTGGNQSSNQSGYLIGLGYKQIITRGLYGFVEGNYMGYSAPSYSYTSTAKPVSTLYGATTVGVRTVNSNFSSLNTYQLLAGLGYAF